MTAVPVPFAVMAEIMELEDNQIFIAHIEPGSCVIVEDVFTVEHVREALSIINDIIAENVGEEHRQPLYVGWCRDGRTIQVEL